MTSHDRFVIASASLAEATTLFSNSEVQAALAWRYGRAAEYVFLESVFPLLDEYRAWKTLNCDAPGDAAPTPEPPSAAETFAAVPRDGDRARNAFRTHEKGPAAGFPVPVPGLQGRSEAVGRRKPRLFFAK